MKVSHLHYAWCPHITNVESETYPHTLVMMTQLVSEKSGMKPSLPTPQYPSRLNPILESVIGYSQFS